MYGATIGSHVWDRASLSELREKIMKTVRWVNITDQSKIKMEHYNCGDWCMFCPLNSKTVPSAERCPKKAQSLFDVVKIEDKNCLPAPSTIGPEKIRLILEKRGEIKKWLDDVYNYELEQAIKGNPVAGMKLVEGRTSPRSYVKSLTDNQVVAKLLDAGLMEDECYQAPKLISPANVKKLLKSLSKIEDILEPETKSLSLVSDSDSREEKGAFPALPDSYVSTQEQSLF